MSVYHEGNGVTLHHGDCLDVLRAMPDNSVDSVVTDPPYGLGFMGKDWDSTSAMHLPPSAHKPTAVKKYPRTGVGPAAVAFDGAAFQAWCLEWTAECLRVLKPGGHLLAFGGTRTWHRLACAVEDAGFEVRDSIAWMYGSGFPKSLDVSKAIDKAVGAEREVVGQSATVTPRSGKSSSGFAPLRQIRWGDEHYAWEDAPAEARAYFEARGATRGQITAPATPDAERWQGWGTALKPAFEPVVCARKPFNAVPLWGGVNHLHHMIGALLWLSLSPAKRAATSSPSSPAGQRAAWCASARVSAATDTSPDGFAATGTCNSPALASTSSSIASSWSAILAALSDPTRMSTTSTASSTTTALRTLSSLLGPITSQTTMPPCGCLLDGSASPARNAATGSTDEWANWLHTLSASVPATATEGIALAAASALAQVAASLSDDLGAGSSADQSATTGAAASGSPAFEPVVVARKPLSGTVAANVLQHGTGALNIDGCRVGTGEGKGVWPVTSRRHNDVAYTLQPTETDTTKGRWPANVVLDESQAAALDEMSGTLTSGANPTRRGADGDRQAYGEFSGQDDANPQRGTDSGGASRFFLKVGWSADDLTMARFMYTAKADASERPRVPRAGGGDTATTIGSGMKVRECRKCGSRGKPAGGEHSDKPWPTCGHDDWAMVEQKPPSGEYVSHPTVKPLALMRWLVRLVTPPGGTVLEPFAGSGTTVEACILEGFRCVAVEKTDEYLPLILARIHRQRDPVAAIQLAAEDLGLFGLDPMEGIA